MKDLRSKIFDLQETLDSESRVRKDAEWKLKQIIEEKDSSLKMSKQGAL